MKSCYTQVIHQQRCHSEESNANPIDASVLVTPYSNIPLSVVGTFPAPYQRVCFDKLRDQDILPSHSSLGQRASMNQTKLTTPNERDAANTKTLNQNLNAEHVP